MFGPQYIDFYGPNIKRSTPIRVDVSMLHRTNIMLLTIEIPIHRVTSHIKVDVSAHFHAPGVVWHIQPCGIQV